MHVTDEPYDNKFVPITEIAWHCFGSDSVLVVIVRFGSASILAPHRIWHVMALYRGVPVMAVIYSVHADSLTCEDMTLKCKQSRSITRPVEQRGSLPNYFSNNRWRKC